MAGYVPNIPGVPAPMSYGQGYGDWQQYAGFGSSKNKYGGGVGYGVQPEDKKQQVAVSPVVDTNVPKAPEEFKADYSIAPQTASPLGNAPSGQLGLTMKTPQSMSAYDAVMSHFGGQ